MPENKLTPQEVLLNAFGYFETNALDQASLVTIALAANCPSEATAIAVLQRMTEQRLLLASEVDGQVMYSLPPPPTDQVQ